MEILIPPIRGIKCSPVKSVDPQIVLQARKLSSGFGIAAPQVGIFERWFLWLGELVINPELHWIDGNLVRELEGCLSLPGVEKFVARSKSIVVSWDKATRRILQGFEARVFLHELDHLNGVFIDDLKTTR